jgi:hypothetical protein
LLVLLRRSHAVAVEVAVVIVVGVVAVAVVHLPASVISLSLVVVDRGAEQQCMHLQKRDELNAETCQWEAGRQGEPGLGVERDRREERERRKSMAQINRLILVAALAAVASTP